MSKEYKVGVLGASGAVGREVLNCLEERGFPFSEVKALASERSAGIKLNFAGGEITVEAVQPNSFQGLDLAIFSAGADASGEYAPLAARDGCPVVDNSSRWRQDDRVPLVVPEVNARVLSEHRGIIANPNCSTIQMLVALKPVYDAVGIKRIVVATYQAVSGTGQRAVEELAGQTRQIFSLQETTNHVYSHRIAFNCLPQIDVFVDNGYTKEEMKMVNETRKIFGDDNLRVSATCVRVPVFYGHSEAVWIETARHIEPGVARELMSRAPGILVVDEPENGRYPMPIDAAGRDEVFVGRIRTDLSCENGLTMWVVADNLRKGAATNAVEIAELLIRDPTLLKTSWEW
ncbi:MAG: aspartate-semialdehyde dehydrogenase [Candidatus Adiutrix intracellularis]|jgi:aspartate-semialdehyde dehydrogenase|nr:aspartate-semialdehyde dehydrogenase [Candidatus Adiutrix intracellularis]